MLRQNPVLPVERSQQWHMPLKVGGQLRGYLVGSDSFAQTVLGASMVPKAGSAEIVVNQEEVDAIAGLVALKKGGPGKGWWGPPKGSHGAGSLSGDAALGSLPVESVEALGAGQKGTNDSYIVTFEDGSQGIFKPQDKMEFGDTRSEVMTYEFAESLGWTDLVPETVAWEYEGRVGSLQRWQKGVDVAVNFKDTAIADSILDGHNDGTPMGLARARITAMDSVLRNGDRHSGNWMRNAEGTQVWAIDNGAAFARDPFERGQLFPSLGAGARFHRNAISQFAEILEWSSTAKAQKWLDQIGAAFGSKTKDEMVAIFAMLADEVRIENK